MKRIVAAALAGVFVANGLTMLFAGAWWYGAIPGVALSGPFNSHFVRDIGVAYLLVASGLGWFAARPAAGWPGLLGAAIYLDLHSAIHIHDALVSPTCGHDLMRDFPGVLLPALTASVLALLSRPERG